MAKTALVTGGTGFIAGWCIVELLRQGYVVRTTLRSPDKAALVRRGVESEADPDDRLTFVTADMTKDDGWDAAVAGCDYVLYIASPLGREAPKDRNALVEPARGGALRVAARGGRGRCRAGGDDLCHSNGARAWLGCGQHRGDLGRS
ncbi:NAD-dependent epimerase/dehydratase family protein [Paracoccus laeviglucosivorans]|uniref:NAD(P)H-binding n=1 Tax=Paracoccus laeviglucosivorans TaxID=1197861 RepID=A0A521ENL2_9RHOB|nr:NAD-dependent epimerase/dehydratase family protein [Paracoccus laeviglucosivorans]SMO85517.1 NAD(P)H-binding [Paracoccus laeviglucosivorans]